MLEKPERPKSNVRGSANRFSTLFKGKEAGPSSFAEQDSRVQRSRKGDAADYDNIGQGTEIANILSARGDDKAETLQKFDGKIERMLKLEMASQTRKIDAIKQ